MSMHSLSNWKKVTKRPDPAGLKTFNWIAMACCREGSGTAKAYDKNELIRRLMSQGFTSVIHVEEMTEIQPTAIESRVTKLKKNIKFMFSALFEYPVK